MRLTAVVLAGSVGSLLGATPRHAPGRALGRARLRRLAARHGRRLTPTPGAVDPAEAWPARHGGAAVLVGRLLPGVRTPISPPAGAARMPPARLLLSAARRILWTAALADAGHLIEPRYELVSTGCPPVSNLAVAGLVALHLRRVATSGPCRAWGRAWSAPSSAPIRPAA